MVNTSGTTVLFHDRIKQAHDSYDECLRLYGGVNNTNLPLGMTLDEKCHNLEHWLSEVRMFFTKICFLSSAICLRALYTFLVVESCLR